MVALQRSDTPVASPPWERLFDLFPQELEQAGKLLAEGRSQLARPYFRRILDTLGGEGNLAVREAEYRAAYRENPKDTAAMNFFAVLELTQGEWEKAAASWKRSLSVNTRQPDILYSLGCVSMSLWRPEDAIDSFAHLLQLIPGHPAAYLRLARCYHALGRAVEASEILDELLGTEFSSQEALALRISCHTALEEPEEARTLMRRALALYPDHTEFFSLLAETVAPPPEDMAVVRAVRAFADASLPEQKRIPLGFGLYRVYEAAGRYGEAFAFLKEANAAQHLRMEYDAGEMTARFATVKAFTPTPLALESAPISADIVPIFVLGMPHSGIASVAHMLSSHPVVHAAGEVDYLPRLAYAEMQKVAGISYPYCLPRLGELGAEAIASLREYYLSRLRAHDGSARYILDTLPENFLCLGMIRALFPEAKIIHCRRDPIATCFSLYRQYLAEPRPYPRDLAALAVFWNEYDALMRHWHALYPEAIHTVRYETSANDAEGEAKKLLAHCGLPWDEARPRPSPAAASRGEDWRHYENELAAFVDGVTERMSCQIGNS